MSSTRQQMAEQTRAAKEKPQEIDRPTSNGKERRTVMIANSQG